MASDDNNYFPSLPNNLGIVPNIISLSDICHITKAEFATEMIQLPTTTEELWVASRLQFVLCGIVLKQRAPLEF